MNETGLSEALFSSLSSLDIRGEDRAAVALARRYAAEIEADPDVLVKVGPLLLAVLVELGMTPRARAAVLKGGGAGGDGAARSKLDEFRDRSGVWKRDQSGVWERDAEGEAP